LALLEYFLDPKTKRRMQALGVSQGWNCLEIGAAPVLPKLRSALYGRHWRPDRGNDLTRRVKALDR
jgi:hypothetical protein